MTKQHDCRYILTGTHDYTVRLWELDSGQEIRKFEVGAEVEAVAFSPDDQYVLTGSSEFPRDTARLSKTTAGMALHGFAKSRLNSVAISPDGKYALTGGFDGIARLWDIANGREIRSFEGHTERITSVAFSGSSRYVLTASYDGTARLCDIADGKETRRLQGHTDTITSASFSPDGQYVVTGSNNRSARLWDSMSGIEIRRFEGHSAIEVLAPVKSL